MIYSRRKLFDYIKDHRLIFVIMFCLIMAASFVLLNQFQQISSHKYANDRISISISQLKFQTSQQGVVTQVFQANQLDIIEPNQIHISSGMELTNLAEDRKFDRVAGRELKVFFQASNTLQVFEKSRMVEAIFPESFEVEKSGSIIRSTNVKADFRSQTFYGEQQTTAEQNSDQVVAEKGFSFNVLSGDFNLNGPISGQVGKLP